MNNDLQRLFDEWGTRPMRTAQNVYPPLNIWEDDDSFHLEAELPGLALDDVEILVSDGNRLSIKGERKIPNLEHVTWQRQERGFGALGRVVELPCDVDADRVSAELCDGVLTVTLPKSEALKPRKIAVKAT
jgi:HSP20 family protein